MSQTVRAIYHDGRLELAEPVKLFEGQSVEITIRSERDCIRAALGDLLVKPDPAARQYTEAELDEMQRQIDEELARHPLDKPLSETIIQERREGP